jgi:hypothetical protein
VRRQSERANLDRPVLFAAYHGRVVAQTLDKWVFTPSFVFYPPIQEISLTFGSMGDRVIPVML